MAIQIGQRVKFQTRNSPEGISGVGTVTQVIDDIGTKYKVEYSYTVEGGPYMGQKVTSFVMCLEEELEISLIDYRKTDLNRKLAEEAHRGTSFSPDIRAQQEIDGYMNEMAAISARFAPFATPENEAPLKAALGQYRKGYLNRLNSRLAAKANCMSTMIAGPSGFNHRRAQKANDTEHRRSVELLEWREKALKRLNRDYNPAVIARRPIRSDEPDAIEQVQAKIDAAQNDQDFMKATNRIVKNKRLSTEDKIAKLVKLEVSEDTARKFVEEPNGHWGYGFAPYQLTNNNANIKRMKARIATLQAEAARPEAEDLEATIDGTPVTVVENRDEGRIQLVFAGKPPADVMKALKGNGFNYSRRNEAWQRLLNDNTRRALIDLIKIEARNRAEIQELI